MWKQKKYITYMKKKAKCMKLVLHLRYTFPCPRYSLKLPPMSDHKQIDFQNTNLKLSYPPLKIFGDSHCLQQSSNTICRSIASTLYKMSYASTYLLLHKTLESKHS